MSETTGPLHDASRPFTIGGVGHRELEGSAAAIEQQISVVFQQLLADHPDEPISLVCSIAEGADRMLLTAAADLGIPYDCVLPCSPDCFREDFQSEESSRQFNRFLTGARTIVQPEMGVEKELGYLWASETVLDRADVLVAVWDGGLGNGPAGTAASVSQASTRGIPVIWIPTHPPYAIRRLSAPRHDHPAARRATVST